MKPPLYTIWNTEVNFCANLKNYNLIKVSAGVENSPKSDSRNFISSGCWCNLMLKIGICPNVHGIATLPLCWIFNKKSLFRLLEKFLDLSFISPQHFDIFTVYYLLFIIYTSYKIFFWKNFINKWRSYLDTNKNFVFLCNSSVITIIFVQVFHL